jgi:hypothetical protein
MVIVAQLVRAPDCGSGGRRFDPGLSPLNLSKADIPQGYPLFLFDYICTSVLNLKRQVMVTSEMMKKLSGREIALRRYL